MAGVAVIGCLLFAVAAVTNGDFDWHRYTSIVGMIVLACAGSWGLSALAAIAFQKSRPFQRGTAPGMRSGPWGRHDAGKIVRLPTLWRRPSGRALTTLLAVAAFLGGLGGVLLFHSSLSRNDSTSRVTIIRSGETAQAGGSDSEARATKAAVAGTAGGGYSLCRSAAQRSCVIDGDTIRHNGTKIRIADIDTPEISEPKCASEAALGHRAKERLLELLNAGSFEVIHPGGRDEDVYGRKLRVLRRDGRSIGMVLVDEGLARRWTGSRRSWCV
jgi:endonuclease YncB( thermonuclease family)